MIGGTANAGDIQRGGGVAHHAEAVVDGEEHTAHPVVEPLPGRGILEHLTADDRPQEPDLVVEGGDDPAVRDLVGQRAIGYEDGVARPHRGVRLGGAAGAWRVRVRRGVVEPEGLEQRRAEGLPQRLAGDALHDCAEELEVGVGVTGPPLRCPERLEWAPRGELVADEPDDLVERHRCILARQEPCLGAASACWCVLVVVGEAGGVAEQVFHGDGCGVVDAVEHAEPLLENRDIVRDDVRRDPRIAVPSGPSALGRMTCRALLAASSGRPALVANRTSRKDAYRPVWSTP
jgi:hypothetical protein